MPGEGGDFDAVGDQAFIFAHGLRHAHPVAQGHQPIEAALTDQRGFGSGVEGGEVLFEQGQRPVGGGEAFGFAGRFDNAPTDLMRGAVGAQGRRGRAVRLGRGGFGQVHGQVAGAEAVEGLQSGLPGRLVSRNRVEQSLAPVKLRRKIPLSAGDIEPRFQYLGTRWMGVAQVVDEGCGRGRPSPVDESVHLPDRERHAFREADQGLSIKLAGVGVSAKITQGFADRLQDIGRRFVQGDPPRQIRRFAIFFGPAEHHQGVVGQPAVFGTGGTQRRQSAQGFIHSALASEFDGMMVFQVGQGRPGMVAQTLLAGG